MSFDPADRGAERVSFCQVMLKRELLRHYIFTLTKSTFIGLILLPGFQYETLSHY